MGNVKSYRMLIDGEWVGASDGKMFDSVNPSTGEVWSQVPEATEQDVDRAVSAAHRAFRSGPWSKMLPTQRGACLRKLAELLACLLYTSPSPRDLSTSRMPSSA